MAVAERLGLKEPDAPSCVRREVNPGSFESQAMAATTRRVAEVVMGTWASLDVRVEMRTPTSLVELLRLEMTQT